MLVDVDACIHLSVFCQLHAYAFEHRLLPTWLSSTAQLCHVGASYLSYCTTRTFLAHGGMDFQVVCVVQASHLMVMVIMAQVLLLLARDGMMILWYYLADVHTHQ